MTTPVRQLFIAFFLFATVSSRPQSVKQLFSNSGIWADYGTPVSPKISPEFKGRLVNIDWSDIELKPNVWNWTTFDDDIAKRTANDMPVIFMVYTRMAAPDWLFSNGVPKVKETDERGNYVGYSPYYLDADYNFYFKRMIREVRKHIEALAPKLRNNIIGVQACFGSTGDYIAYKGNVARQYEITDAQFDSLFKVYSLYYYNEYKDLVPKIKMLSNPGVENREEHYWIIENCPGGWIKCPFMAQGFQLNMELDKHEWLYDVLNKPWSGSYIKSRSEIVGAQLDVGWWKKNEYKNLFALMCYGVYWGLDWPNETKDILVNHKHDSALHFFNKYAGQKVPAVATNAMCALKDALDASNEIRFPASQYGKVDRENKSRYINIYERFKTYGAKLEDQSVLAGREYDCLNAKGTNDVGWRLLPGNYERYLKQINPNATSAGYWNVDDEHNDVMYGRFARGFDLAKGKDALYFDLEDVFLRGAPLNSDYPVTIEITYYDKGTGGWQLYYDAQANVNKPSVAVNCKNTRTWKKKAIVLNDAYFGNRSKRGSDFYIKSTNGSDVIFSVVELSRPGQSAHGFVTSSLAPYHTVCLNSTPSPKSFVLNGGYLNGESVQVGPLKGYKFASSQDGPFYNVLTYEDYGRQINSTVYVKINTGTEGDFEGNIPIAGGGAKSVFVKAKASVLNTSPRLNANVTPVSCYNKSDGAINLRPTDGIGPYTFEWTKSEQPWWNATTQDIKELREANYTVLVKSSSGCSFTKTFKVTQPEKLEPPPGIKGPSSVKHYQTGVEFSIADPKAGYKYIWSVPFDASITSGQNTASIRVKWGKHNGDVKSRSQTDCGTSTGTQKYVKTFNSVDAETNSSIQTTSQTDKITKLQMMVTPNPTKNIAVLQFYAESSYPYSVQLADMTGKILLSKRGTAAAGANIEKFDVGSFANGYYFLTLTNNKSEKQTIKLLKE